MNPEFKLKQFNGPLDLLSSLIDEKEIDISELALSEVTEQFLNHLDQVEKNRPEKLVDFLVVATRLLFIKSNRLLPQFAPEEEEEGPSLEDQLRLYRAFVHASKKLNKMWQEDGRSIFRNEPPRQSTEFNPPNNLNHDNLIQSFRVLLKKIEPPKPLPKTQIDKTISIKEKINVIRKILKSSKQTEFNDILDMGSRTEIIVSFLAILELVKQKDVFLKQDKNFSNILIRSH